MALLLFPLSLALIREPSKSKLRKFLIFLINIFILISIYLTKSRSGWIGTFIGTTLIAKSSFLFIILSIFIIFITILIFALVPIIPSFQKYAILIIPEKILARFKLIGFTELNYPRFLLWKSLWN